MDMFDMEIWSRFASGLFRLSLLAVALLAPPDLGAQSAPATVTIRATSEAVPVAGATVRAGGLTRVTDEAGEAVLALPAGEHRVQVERLGLRSTAVTVTVEAGAALTVTVELEPEALHMEEEIIVASTRTDRRIEDEPIRVEVVGREEVEEKLLMTPGDISMLLNETAGLRVQPTSPALGGAGVRIQGMRGRFTQILSDGLPLHGGQTGALGPLQIPPMDLARVEVIKGAASALYGASALGGVVNLISRRPAERNERELLVNQSTLGGTDAILWNSGPIGGAWGYTLLAGAHRQEHVDTDDDAWADLPAFRRASVRPRLFWSDGRGGSAMVTVGAMVEDRNGGVVGPGSSVAGDYVERLSTDRFDAGVVGRLLLGGSTLLNARGSASLQRHGHDFAGLDEDDEHRTAFAEAAVSGTAGPHTWVLGAAVQHDRYVAEDVSGFDFSYTVPGLFAQADLAPARWLSVSGSGRLDDHSRYGSFLSPRLSVLLRPADDWTVRGSVGAGYFAPTPWTDETEAVGLRRVVPPDALDAERARTASLDIGRAFGALELNATVFGSIIEDPVQVRRAADDRLELFNAAGPVRTRGTELLARYHAEDIHVTATHVHLRATEPYPAGPGRREVPLTPRHTAGLVAMWEREGRSRIGGELYYTGRQELEDNPYRFDAEPHVIVGFLVEHRVGPIRLFLNAENIFDTRQTRYDPLVLPVRSPEGRWTTDVWAPLEGRAFNGGVRWEF